MLQAYDIGNGHRRLVAAAQGGPNVAVSRTHGDGVRCLPRLPGVEDALGDICIGQGAGGKGVKHGGHGLAQNLALAEYSDLFLVNHAS